MPQFDINSYYSQIFWLIIAFSILYFFIYKFITPNIEKILNNREATIQDNIQQAEELALKIEHLNKYYYEEIAKITNRIKELKNTAINAMESSFINRKLDLENDLKKQIEENTININLITKKFRQEEDEPSIKLAVNIIEKITGMDVDINLLKNIAKK